MSEKDKSTALNGICPYFTMFPLDFPHAALSQHAVPGQWVMDPFCGRGTTNYASRMLGLPSIGIDSSPVAAAVAQAKLVNTTPEAIVRAAERVLDAIPEPHDVPDGEFWKVAFHPDVLRTLCRLREGLLKNCRSSSGKGLRAIILGALHGPRGKTVSSYFSNQSQRTYAPKPRYAVHFWRKKGFSPVSVDVLKIIRRRANWYYGDESKAGVGKIILGDSRNEKLFSSPTMPKEVAWIVTSPPYYGMRTYLPDQWLRLWFLGGPPSVAYGSKGQLSHSSPEEFAKELRQVWENVASVSLPTAKMVIRFGGIHDRKADPLPLLFSSLKDSGWRMTETVNAGSATSGRRQALHFSAPSEAPMPEYDVWVAREP